MLKYLALAAVAIAITLLVGSVIRTMRGEDENE